jgi:hypothetical protein
LSLLKASSQAPLEKRLRVAGIFVLLGLLVEVAALRWVHPAAFLVFAFAGIPLASLGILIYLYSLLSFRGLDESNELGAVRKDNGGSN